MRHLITSAIALALLAGSLSPAYTAESRQERAGHHDRGDRNEHRGHDRNDRNDHRNDRHWDGRSAHDNRGRHDDNRGHDRNFHNDRNFHRPDFRGHDSHRFYGGVYHRPHGYRYYSWSRGDRLPVAYYAPRYVVRDYRAYRLYAPPRGYHWVRVDNDVILAAITTGIVVQVVSGLFY